MQGALATPALGAVPLVGGLEREQHDAGNDRDQLHDLDHRQDGDRATESRPARSSGAGSVRWGHPAARRPASKGRPGSPAPRTATAARTHPASRTAAGRPAADPVVLTSSRSSRACLEAMIMGHGGAPELRTRHRLHRTGEGAPTHAVPDLTWPHHDVCQHRHSKNGSSGHQATRHRGIVLTGHPRTGPRSSTATAPPGHCGRPSKRAAALAPLSAPSSPSAILPHRLRRVARRGRAGPSRSCLRWSDAWTTDRR